MRHSALATIRLLAVSISITGLIALGSCSGPAGVFRKLKIVSPKKKPNEETSNRRLPGACHFDAASDWGDNDTVQIDGEHCASLSLQSDRDSILVPEGRDLSIENVQEVSLESRSYRLLGHTKLATLTIGSSGSGDSGVSGMSGAGDRAHSDVTLSIAGSTDFSGLALGYFRKIEITTASREVTHQWKSLHLHATNLIVDAGERDCTSVATQSVGFQFSQVSAQVDHAELNGLLPSSLEISPFSISEGGSVSLVAPCVPRDAKWQLDSGKANYSVTGGLRVLGDFVIIGGGKFTLAAGSGVSIAGGQLAVIGSANQPITFSGPSSGPTAGATGEGWAGISASDPASRLRLANVATEGAGVSVQSGARAVVMNTTVTGGAITFDAASSVQFDGSYSFDGLAGNTAVGSTAIPDVLNFITDAPAIDIVKKLSGTFSENPGCQAASAGGSGSFRNGLVLKVNGADESRNLTIAGAAAAPIAGYRIDAIEYSWVNATYGGSACEPESKSLTVTTKGHARLYARGRIGAGSPVTFESAIDFTQAEQYMQMHVPSLVDGANQITYCDISTWVLNTDVRVDGHPCGSGSGMELNIHRFAPDMSSLVMGPVSSRRPEHFQIFRPLDFDETRIFTRQP